MRQEAQGTECPSPAGSVFLCHQDTEWEVSCLQFEILLAVTSCWDQRINYSSMCWLPPTPRTGCKSEDSGRPRTGETKLFPKRAKPSNRNVDRPGKD